MKTIDNKTATLEGALGKRAYIKPAFRSESVFETMALACGKINATSGPCGQVRKAS